MGFKKTSETIAISFDLLELAANTFIQDEIALQLDILNNEIFVVLAVDLDVTDPDAIPGANTSVNASITSTSVTALPNLGNSNCIATARNAIRAAGFVDSGVGFTRAADSTVSSDVDYIALISTNNFFVQLVGLANASAKQVSGRVWGYRARADASTYAALVQSEVLSA
jgi:hypothetical protein